MTDSKFTFLFTPLDAVGHYNGSIGLAEELLRRGHRVIYAVHDRWRNLMKAKGFEEEWYNSELEAPVSTNTEIYDDFAATLGPAFLTTTKEQIKSIFLHGYAGVIKETQKAEPILRRIVQKVKPDVIVVDMFFHQPAVMSNGGIPWVLVVSATSSCFSDENSPPYASGYSSDPKYKDQWEEYRKEYESVMTPTLQEFKKWLVENGGPSDLKIPRSPVQFIQYSKYANIYMCPEELDWIKFRPNPPNFHRFDTFMRSEDGVSFEIPESLKGKPGKLIYFSMGTIGSSELGMMRRLISILAKSPNRFIISKGPRSDEIELSDNMWGAKSLPQTKVIPLVDFVISHGGNNTVTESFYFGKPLIILPLFGDQPDNAQGVVEAGLGIRLHSHKCTESELLNAVEDMAKNDKLVKRMSEISKRIQSSNSQGRAADLIEEIAHNNKV